ncbi:MAG: helix-hairpin-helix domain-containing protein [Anaerolineales bacterium]|nr:helix-hairpin-helix domain-containing protein [Anaerolineales bacterium]MDW8226989.1 helix-hairpin-helix domain-containing protein [Anaerolineales bacterium]
MFYRIAQFGEGHQGSGEITWLLWVALVFFALMVIIGWSVSRKKTPVEENKHEGQEAHHETAETHAPVEDDLTILEGIGPKVAQVLQQAGIRTFADLAHADVGRVQEILKAAGLQMMNPSGWIEQARLAAAGDMEGLKRLQAELKSGRRI